MRVFVETHDRTEFIEVNHVKIIAPHYKFSNSSASMTNAWDIVCNGVTVGQYEDEGQAMHAYEGITHLLCSNSDSASAVYGMQEPMEHRVTSTEDSHT